MAKISINLLPTEIITKELKKANFYRIQLAGIIVILIMVFLASLTVALRILQSRSITEVQAKISETEQQVSDLKDTQAALILLKDRITVIDKYLGVSSNQSLMYKLIDKLIPPDVIINGISINKTGEVTLVVLVPDASSLDNLIESFTNRDSNEEKISLIGIESLNRGRDGFYRGSLTIKPK